MSFKPIAVEKHYFSTFFANLFVIVSEAIHNDKKENSQKFVQYQFRSGSSWVIVCDINKQLTKIADIQWTRIYCPPTVVFFCHCSLVSGGYKYFTLPRCFSVSPFLKRFSCWKVVSRKKHNQDHRYIKKTVWKSDYGIITHNENRLALLNRQQKFCFLPTAALLWNSRALISQIFFCC